MPKFVAMCYLDNHDGETPDLFFIDADNAKDAETVAYKRKGFSDDEIAFINEESELTMEELSEIGGTQYDDDFLSSIRCEVTQIEDELFTK